MGWWRHPYITKVGGEVLLSTEISASALKCYSSLSNPLALSLGNTFLFLSSFFLKTPEKSAFLGRPWTTSLLPLAGLAQCAELCWQLRGQAGRRQVGGAKVALQHNIGLGGAVVVTLYRLGFPQGGRSESFYIILGQTSLLICTTALVHASFRLPYGIVFQILQSGLLRNCLASL